MSSFVEIQLQKSIEFSETLEWLQDCSKTILSQVFQFWKKGATTIPERGVGYKRLVAEAVDTQTSNVVGDDIVLSTDIYKTVAVRKRTGVGVATSIENNGIESILSHSLKQRNKLGLSAEMLIENSLNSGNLSTETILSQATKVEGATTIPNGSTLKRGEAVSIFGRNSKMVIWSDLTGDRKQSACQTGGELATPIEHNWVTLPLRSTCPLDLVQQQR